MFFLGLPSLLLYLNEFVLISIVLVFSFLMISDFKFYSFKSLKNKDEKQFLFVLILLQLVIIIFSFVYDAELASLLSFMILAYILSCFIISGINKEASSN
jgi:phosphatidylserine synthase